MGLDLERGNCTACSTALGNLSLPDAASCNGAFDKSCDGAPWASRQGDSREGG